MLRLHLEQVDATDVTIADIDKEVERMLEPFRAQVTLLKTMPGIRDLLASTLLAEIGADMTQFPTAAHLVSWAGLCPQLRESAGKRKSTRVRKGAPWLKPVLVQAAWSAVRKKDSCLRAQFYRVKSRRGPKKAIRSMIADVTIEARNWTVSGSIAAPTPCPGIGLRSSLSRRRRSWGNSTSMVIGTGRGHFFGGVAAAIARMSLISRYSVRGKSVKDSKPRWA